MKFSIIVPSFNQDQFIAETFSNIRQLKSIAAENGFEIEALLFDNKSNENVQQIIRKYVDVFDVLEIVADRGQYDAINHGIQRISGDYWTWLNTDDTMDIDGFIKLAKILSANNNIDYIYGDIEIIDENSKAQKIAKAGELTTEKLINDNPGIFQPGSFFRTQFTKQIGPLAVYRCCFDYEYILRILANGGKLHRCDFTVAQFRFYETSKSGSIVPVFIREQLEISRRYGRKALSRLTIISFLRLLKRKITG